MGEEINGDWIRGEWFGEKKEYVGEEDGGDWIRDENVGEWFGEKE